MKRLIIIAFSAFVAAGASAQVVKGYMAEPSAWKLTRNGNMMDIDLSVSLADMDVKSNSLVTLTPRLVNGRDIDPLDGRILRPQEMVLLRKKPETHS